MGHGRAVPLRGSGRSGGRPAGGWLRAQKKNASECESEAFLRRYEVLTS